MWKTETETNRKMNSEKIDTTQGAGKKKKTKHKHQISQWLAATKVISYITCILTKVLLCVVITPGFKLKEQLLSGVSSGSWQRGYQDGRITQWLSNLLLKHGTCNFHSYCIDQNKWHVQTWCQECRKCNSAYTCQQTWVGNILAISESIRICEKNKRQRKKGKSIIYQYGNINKTLYKCLGRWSWQQIDKKTNKWKIEKIGTLQEA